MREVRFARRKVTAPTLGECLRKLRAEAQVTLDVVASSTRIPAVHLAHLEDGRYESLPADVYVRGFLRGIASYFGVECDLLLRLYEREQGIVRRNISVEKPSIPALREARFVITPSRLMVVGGASVVVLIVGYLWWALAIFSGTPLLVINAPLTGAVVEGTTVRLEGVTDPDATLRVNEQPIAVAQNGSFAHDVPLASGLNTLTVDAVTSRGGQTRTVVVVESRAESVVLGAMTLPLALEISAQRSVELIVRDVPESANTGNLEEELANLPTLFTGRIVPEQPLILTVHSGRALVESSDALHTRVIVDTVERGSLGLTAVPTSVLITRDGISQSAVSSEIVQAEDTLKENQDTNLQEKKETKKQSSEKEKSDKKR